MAHKQYTMQGLMPANNQRLAAKAAFVLPVGGPVGVGGPFAQGQALGLIGGAVANQVDTLTITTNSSTGGTGYWTFYANDVYSGLTAPGGITANAVTGWPTAAQMTAALVAAVPSWSGNVNVTGSQSANYSITWSNLMAGKKIGGLLLFTFNAHTAGTLPTGAITVATTGNAGSAQADIYSQASNNRVDGFLQWLTVLDPVGCEPTEYGDAQQAAAGQPVFTSGIFNVDATTFPGAVVVGLDTNALTLGKLNFVQGTSLTDVAAQVGFNY